MMSYLKFMITELETVQAAQIWFQNFYFNQLKKTCDQIHVYILPSLKSNALQKRTVCASNAAHVIVEIIAG